MIVLSSTRVVFAQSDSWSGKWRVTLLPPEGETGEYTFTIELEQSGNQVSTISSDTGRPGVDASVGGTVDGRTFTGKLRMVTGTDVSSPMDMTWVLSDDGLTFTGDWWDPIEFKAGKVVGERLSGIPSGELRVEIRDENTRDYCVFTVRVFDPITEKPIKDAKLDIRIFYVYDADTKEWFNGLFEDYGPYSTDGNGQYSWPWRWTTAQSGDVWRIDVYASKEGYNDDDASTSVTGGAMSGSGEGPYTTATTRNILRVEIQDDNTANICHFTITVFDVETEKPIEKARIDLRIFYVYDASANKWINGEYWDEPPYYTNSHGQLMLDWTWDPNRLGDGWRIDVQASKDGYNEASTNTYVTEGAVMMMTTPTVLDISTQPVFQKSDDVGKLVSEKERNTQTTSSQEPIQSQIPRGYPTIIGIVALVAIACFMIGRRFFPGKKKAETPQQ
jgi:hypothetical protein